MKPPRSIAVVASLVVIGCTTYAAEDAPRSDGGADAGSDATAKPFCESITPAPFFCADFDDGKPFAYGFTEDYGDLAIDESVSTSSPASLKAGVDSLLSRTFEAAGTPKKRQHLSFSVRFGNPGPTAVPPSASIVHLKNAAGSCTITIAKGDAHWTLETQTPAGTDVVQMPFFPVDGVWTRIDISLEASTDITMSARVDGNEVAPPAVTGCTALGELTLRIGAQYAESGEVRFDDVVLEGE